MEPTTAWPSPSTADDTPIAAPPRRPAGAAGRVGDPLPRPPTTRVLTVANQKGGVGKTTTTVNLAAALALHGLERPGHRPRPAGQRLDRARRRRTTPRCRASTTCSSTGARWPRWSQRCPDIPGLWCAPATIDLAGAEIELVSLVARETRLQKAIAAYLDQWCRQTGTPGFDYVLIDCPPCLGLLTVNALVAAPEVLIPIQCEYYALEGCQPAAQQHRAGQGAPQPRAARLDDPADDVRRPHPARRAGRRRGAHHFPDAVLRTTIPRSVRISEAPSYGQTVMTYDPGSTGALSYLEAAREMALREPTDRASGTEDDTVSDKRRGLGRGLGALIPTGARQGREAPADAARRRSTC